MEAQIFKLETDQGSLLLLLSCPPYMLSTDELTTHQGGPFHCWAVVRTVKKSTLITINAYVWTLYIIYLIVTVVKKGS